MRSGDMIHTGEWLKWIIRNNKSIIKCVIQKSLNFLRAFVFRNRISIFNKQFKLNIMKKTLLVMFVALFAISYQSKAQLGVKLGYNFAKMSGLDTGGADEKSLNNLVFGAFMEKDLIPLLDIRLGAEFSPKGMRVESGSDFSELKINYLEIPVQAKVKLGPFFVLGGVYSAFALKGSYEQEFLGVTSKDDNINFDDYNLKKFDYGMKFGAGVQVGLGPLHAFTQVEYSFGLQNLNKGDGDAIKNNVLCVSAGVVLGF